MLVGNVNTGGILAIIGAGVAALLAGIYQTRTARAAAQPNQTTAIGTEYQRLVQSLQVQIDRQGHEIDELRRDLHGCEVRHAVSNGEIAKLKAEIGEMHEWARLHRAGELKERKEDDDAHGS